MIAIDEFMTPDPFTLGESDSINDAWEIMTEKHIRHIPVTDKDNHLLGLVTQRDVLAATTPGSSKENQDIKISDIMIRNVTIVHKTDSLRQAAVYLQSHKYGCLPVISDKQLVGIITDSDFISIAINLLEQVELLEEGGSKEDIDDDVTVSELNGIV